jgi:hypothetical protein
MSRENCSYFYDISVRGLKQPSLFENEAEKVIKEISHLVGWDSPTRICLEPVSTAKHLYALSLLTEVNGKPVMVDKEGKNVFSLLTKVKRLAKKQIRKIQYEEAKRLKRQRRCLAPLSPIWETF